MKALALKAADLLGAARFAAWRHRRLLPILMYHGVIERPLSMGCWHMLPAARFEEQLRWVARRYRVLPLSEALTHLQAGTLPPRSCAITLDDGYQNNQDVAFPILQRLGLPATIFVVTSLVGTQEVLWPDRLWLLLAGAQVSELDLSALGLGRRTLGTAREREAAYVQAVTALKAMPAPAKDACLERLTSLVGGGAEPAAGPFRLMGWDAVRSLAASGLVSFGAHTTHHEILRHQNDEAVARAVTDSHTRLSKELGATPSVFAYPNGRLIDFDQRAIAAVEQAGIPFALSTVKGLAGTGSPPRALPRISIGNGTPLHRFRLEVSGALRKRG